MFDYITGRLRGWRTMLFNALAGLPILADVAMQVINLPEFRDVLPDEWLPGYALFVVLVNMYLRKKTKTPLGKKL